ncbi:hypothetical protein [Pedobacter steynii]|uniref:Uncharacterized protein n=1 Tax=Pedobacter steynii TaxID=430522 RepID=A0A1D7QLU4_9SPHI|nr:hypothetical protein [Pedobacter steynii]AOM79648.1 hypothetical protein BFS30_22315 [Pedobacter steynii]
MENQNQSPEEEIVNPGQFQVGRNPEEQENEQNDEGTADTEETGYTPGETEFADGEGTRLNEEIEEQENDPETEDYEDQDTDTENDEDADYENPKDDPA